MILCGIDFGAILTASGALGFFGEGYSHHKLLRLLGLNYEGCTFVAKTTTLSARKGNMLLKDDGMKQGEFSPKCIVPNIWRPLLSIRMFWNCNMLNAVALSGPGAEILLNKGLWQQRENPFFLSFMPVEDSAEKRLEESKKFVELLSARLPEFKSKIGLQVNYSCPNVGHNPSLLVNEVMSALPIFGKLGIPIMPKFNVLAPVGAVKEIAEDANCDAICIPNTIPFGKLPNKINWKNLFGADVSPLAHLGGGGFSGPQQFPLVLEWIKNAREIGIKKPINAGSVYEIDHIDMLRQVGASSISLGSVMTLRPWRVKQLIQRAHQLF